MWKVAVDTRHLPDPVRLSGRWKAVEPDVDCTAGSTDSFVSVWNGPRMSTSFHTVSTSHVDSLPPVDGGGLTRNCISWSACDGVPSPGH